MTVLTGEALVSGMPVLTLVAHLALIYSNGFPTCIAVLSKHTVETCETVRSALSHDIPLSTQVTITLETGKMLHVPSSSFGLGALIRENNLVARRAPWFSSLCMMPATVELPVLVEVDQVDEEFLADSAMETGGMPSSHRTSSTSRYTDVTTKNSITTSLTSCRILNSDRQLLYSSSTQSITFPLGREQA